MHKKGKKCTINLSCYKKRAQEGCPADKGINVIHMEEIKTTDRDVRKTYRAKRFIVLSCSGSEVMAQAEGVSCTPAISATRYSPF